MTMNLFYAAAAFAVVNTMAVTPTQALDAHRKRSEGAVGIRNKNPSDVAGAIGDAGSGDGGATRGISRQGRTRRLLYPSGKRSVLLYTPKGMSKMEFHHYLTKHGFRIIDDEDSHDEMGVKVFLSQEQIHAMAEDYHDDQVEGMMKLVSDDTDDDLEVQFLDGEEADQESFIQMASDPSFICMEGAAECAGKSMVEFYESYQQPDAIFQRLDDLTAQHQGFVRKSSFGKTYQERDQVLYKLTNYDKAGWENNRVVVYICGTHPREAVATMTCPYIMENLLLNEQDESSSDFNLANGLLNEITFIIIPILNLDGFYFCHEFDEDILLLKEALDKGTLGSTENMVLWQRYRKSKMWRKTMKPNNVRCQSASSWDDVGVDPEGFNDGVSLDLPFNQTQCIQ
mmetsp:Transcript_17011/g.36655  ORF Transcript_17011/g.36655 Transcript_17011/m.36655 type:complete len:398 (-) Transcript_17011:929-2122(-)